MHPRRSRATRGASALVLALTAALLSPSAASQSAVTNSVPNPSVERSAGAKPGSWLQIASGSNARSFRYLYGGAADGRRFVRTKVTARRTGYAGWSFAPVAVRGGGSYTYGDAYRSNTTTVLRARYVDARGRVSYRNFTPAPPVRGWKRSGITFTIPAGTVRMSMERLLTSPGTLDVDATLLRLRSAPKPAPKPAPASAALVSVTFDDGLTNQYDNARPVLAANAIPATFYLIANNIGAGSYMSVAQARTLQAAGHEIGSHSATHANLPTLSGDQLTAELAGSKGRLEASFGTVRSLAYPYGAYNDTVRSRAAQIYQTARTTDGGLNVAGSIDRSRLRMKYVTSGTDAATVASWMSEAANANAWTILVYHGVDSGGGTYSVTPQVFAAHMAAVKASGLRTLTVSKAYATVG